LGNDSAFVIPPGFPGFLAGIYNPVQSGFPLKDCLPGFYQQTGGNDMLIPNCFEDVGMLVPKTLGISTI
jgi:hypothetical protein